jgi:hypothetical protein
VAALRRSTTIGTATKTSVGTSAVSLGASNPKRTKLLIEADAANSGTIYLGDSGVTTASGFGELLAGESIELETSAQVYAIASAASQNVRTLELTL